MADQGLSKLEELMKQRQQLDAELKKLSRQVTLMFTDMVGSTRYFETYGDVDGMVYVHKCHDLLIPSVEAHSGTVCKTIGDAVMAFYPNPSDAVKAAIEMQQKLDDYNVDILDKDQQIHIRIGLNYGPGMVKDRDVFGDVVNVAARIEALAKSEQIYLSESLAKEVADLKLPLKVIPDVAVKGKEQKLVIHEVMWRELKREVKKVSPPTTVPSIAARVPVAEAAKPTSEQKGTVVLGGSPVAVIGKPKLGYSLVVVRPDGSHGQACKLEKKESQLGRVEGDIRFPEDPLVSRKHARFTVGDDGLLVEDMNSANGIFWRLRVPYPLQDKDVILMGRLMFRFAVGQGDANVTPAPAAKGAPAKSTTGSGKLNIKAELIRLLPGGVEENHYVLGPGENILGRTRGNLTFAEDSYVSSQHARIKNEGGNCTLEDLQSGNGTFVQVRQKTKLQDGDIILIGHQLLRITTTA